MLLNPLDMCKVITTRAVVPANLLVNCPPDNSLRFGIVYLRSLCDEISSNSDCYNKPQ